MDFSKNVNSSIRHVQKLIWCHVKLAL
jgi:hypothetical protein